MIQREKYWGAILLLALLLRFAAACYWENKIALPSVSIDHFHPSLVEKSDGESGVEPQDGPFFFGDSDSYWKLGRAIAFGRSYQFDEQRHWTVFRMPGYPALLAPLFWIQGEHPSVFSARVLNVLLGTVVVLLTGLLAYHFFGREEIALLAAFFAAIDPCAIIQSVLVLSEAPFVVLLLLQLLLLVNIEANFSWKSLILLGVVSALTVYFRPSWLYFVPFVLVLGLFFSIDELGFFQRIKRLSLRLMVVVAVFAICMSPWWIRNYCVTGRFVATTLQMGASLYDGLSPKADGSSQMDFIDEFRQLEKEFPSGDPAKEHFEVRLDQRMKSESVKWSLAHPSRVLELAVIKFGRLWNPFPNEPAFSSSKIKILLALSYLPIMILGMLGGGFIVREEWRKHGGLRAAILWAPVLYLTLLHIIFVSSLRYRTPAMFGLMIFAAWMVYQIKKHKTLEVFSKKLQRDHFFP